MSTRSIAHLTTASQKSFAGEDPRNVSGNTNEPAETTTPPRAKAIPPQTPSFSLSGRTKESLRIARERQLESLRKPTRATVKPGQSVNNATMSRDNTQNASSVSMPCIQTRSAVNPSKSRPNTPNSSYRPYISTTAASPRQPKHVPTGPGSESPKITPTAVRKTSAGSSIAVRDAIRKAKEAHKQKTKTTLSLQSKPVDYNDEASFEDIDNPFNTSPGTPPLQAQLKRSIENGRTTGIVTCVEFPLNVGNLNISNLELREIPDDVYSMYDLSTKSVVVDFSSKSSGWYDSVDLERFNASGNEISQIDDLISEEFGGIKHFDVANLPYFANVQMHSNKLVSLPSNFQSLKFLRTLNLSKNRLSGTTLDLIFLLTTLVEVYLANNDIQGSLPSSVGTLRELQILDLEGNQITSLPDTFGNLQRMRILLLGDNLLESVPWEVFGTFRDLYELDISSNRLSGDLLPDSLDSTTLPSLSNLNIHSNSLTSLPSNLLLPSLTQLNASQNSIVTTGTFFINTPRLVHLSIAQNQFSALPDGVVHLSYLRTLDVSNNVIENVDPRLGFLDRLTTFMWMGNLIRARGWGSMDTEGIKSILRAKADEAALQEIDGDFAELNIDACRGECGGTLNLTGELKEDQLTEDMISRHIHPTHFPSLSKVVLQQNKLTTAPQELSLVVTMTTLDLSKNYLSSHIFDQPISLMSLIQLDLSVNRLDTLEHLPSVLSAPSLKILDVSFNNLTSLAPLHMHYPGLTTLYANSNQLASVTPTDFEGLEIVQVNNNSINKLPPELGLVESLRVLGVDGNTFRVPGRRIVDAGSAALLEWLRGRCVIP